MGGEYSKPTKSQATPPVNPSAGDSHGQKIQLREVWGRLLRCSLPQAATHPLRACQCKAAARSQPVHCGGPLLQDMPSGSCAHGCARLPTAFRSLELSFCRSPRLFVRTQKSAFSPVAGSLWALSVGNAGEHPTTSGAERLPASKFRPGSPKVTNALLSPERSERGEAGERGARSAAERVLLEETE